MRDNGRARLLGVVQNSGMQEPEALLCEFATVPPSPGSPAPC